MLWKIGISLVVSFALGWVVGAWFPSTTHNLFSIHGYGITPVMLGVVGVFFAIWGKVK